MYAAPAMAAFLTLRYYGKLMYPFLKVFESYYVEKMQLIDSLDKVQITWAKH